MNRLIGIVVLCLMALSCSSELDFDQVNDTNLAPIIIANLATFDVQANQFVIGGVEQTVSGDLINFETFNDSFFDKNMTKAEMFFEFKNTINRAFKINILLIDANNTPIYTIPFNVPEYSGTPNLVKKTEIFENTNLELLKNTVKVAFVITLMPGPALSENSLGNLKLRSSATVYFLVK